MRLALRKGAVYEGVQLFTLTHICEDCHGESIVFLGPAISMPLSTALADLLVEAETGHECPHRKPPPPLEDAARMPY